jgi:hypothetical protein
MNETIPFCAKAQPEATAWLIRSSSSFDATSISQLFSESSFQGLKFYLIRFGARTSDETDSSLETRGADSQQRYLPALGRMEGAVPLNS